MSVSPKAVFRYPSLTHAERLYERCDDVFQAFLRSRSRGGNLVCCGRLQERIVDRSRWCRCLVYRSVPYHFHASWCYYQYFSMSLNKQPHSCSTHSFSPSSSSSVVQSLTLTSGSTLSTSSTGFLFSGICISSSPSVLRLS